MEAIILAGGKGARLKPYTTLIPKPIVPVGDKAILEILIERLKINGVTKITLCINHFAELIKAYFGDGSRFNIKIEYSREEKPLSTVAPIKLINGLPDNFLVMNGDLLTDLNFADFFQHHLDHNSLLTVATYKRETKIDFGVIEMNDKRNVATGFIEKPTYHFDVSMGVYAFNKKVLNFVPYNEPFGFDDLMTLLLEKKEDIRLYPFTGKWLDIGRPDDYEKAVSEYSEQK